MLQDEDIFPYGKYNDSKTIMEDVPAWYLMGQYDFFKDQILWTKSGPARVVAYVADNLDELKKELDG
jgi:hypothetical protein